MRSNAVGGYCTLSLAWEGAVMMPLHYPLLLCSSTSLFPSSSPFPPTSPSPLLHLSSSLSSCPFSSSSLADLHSSPLPLLLSSCYSSDPSSCSLAPVPSSIPPSLPLFHYHLSSVPSHTLLSCFSNFPRLPSSSFLFFISWCISRGKREDEKKGEETM